MIHVDYRDGRPIYQQIMESIRRQIVSGVLGSGDRLPSVRELAMQLSINPNTIQRAYRQMEMEGWIATVPGKGCFVSGIPGGSIEEAKAMEDFLKTVRRLVALGYSEETLVQKIKEETQC